MRCEKGINYSLLANKSESLKNLIVMRGKVSRKIKLGNNIDYQSWQFLNILDLIFVR